MAMAAMAGVKVVARVAVAAVTAVVAAAVARAMGTRAVAREEMGVAMGLWEKAVVRVVGEKEAPVAV
eukprot:4180050-Prymnesium_polylepis.1